MNKKYTWRPDVPDHRDHVFKSEAKVVKFVDPIGTVNPVENQGNLGSCTGNSATSALEITLIKDMKLTGMALSRLFAYYNARVIEKTVGVDAGAEIRNVVKGLFKTGVSSEKKWPYKVTKFKTKPTEAAYIEAANLVAAIKGQYEYARVADLKTLKASLAAGNPVVFGFMVPEAFDNLSGKFILKLPKKTEASLGGHAVVAVGYDDRPAKPFIWVRNSWGAEWGLNGYFKMTQDWFTSPDRLVDDLWLIRKKG